MTNNQSTNDQYKPQSTSFSKYADAFGQWLEILGYEKENIKRRKRFINEYLWWMEKKGVPTVDRIREYHNKAYRRYLSYRKKRIAHGGLSISYINNNISSLHLFSQYLNRCGIKDKIKLLYFKEAKNQERNIITIQQVKQLYKATDDSLLGNRDRAMLSLLYGCGLRRSECVNLNVKDILFERKLLHIKKTKTNTQRFVPISGKNMIYIKEYLEQARPFLVERDYTEAFMVGVRGGSLGLTVPCTRLKILAERTKNTNIIEKNISPHTLRHSIATHFMQKGMPLEKIASFLGHKTMNTTQIYTHLVKQL